MADSIVPSAHAALSPSVLSEIYGALGGLRTAEAAIATAACALDGKAADQLPEIARTLRRCAGDAVFSVIQELEALANSAELGSDEAAPDEGKGSAETHERQPEPHQDRSDLVDRTPDTIQAMESEVAQVLSKLTCAHHVLWSNEAVDKDEMAGRASALVRECVIDLERILRYDADQSAVTS